MAERKHGWGPRDQNVLIGKEITRIDALPKIVGAAKYSADINTKGTLFAKLVTCKHAHAILKKIDVEAAKKVPGVKAVHLFKELDDEIRWDGDLIAAVAAERAEQAADGVKAIEATIEYEVLEHFVDEADLEAGKKADRARERGSAKEAAAETQNEAEIDAAIDAAIKGAKAVHKGSYGIQTISHMCLEPHGSHCEWKGEELDVHLSTQNVSGTAGQFAEPLGIDQANVTITGNYEGGGFGSKFQADEWGLAAAKMAQETGRPVRLMLDRATELKVAGTRPSGFEIGRAHV